MSTTRELTFDVPSETPELVVAGSEADVLLDPLRWRMLEALGSGLSIAELSQALGVTDARLIYHASRLAEVGIVLFDARSNPRSSRCEPVARRLIVHEPANATSAPEAIPAAITDDFSQAFREVVEGVFGTAPQVAVNHNRSRMSKDQAAEFSFRLLALIEEYFPPGKGDQTGIKYGFYGVFTPIDLHPHGG